MKFPQFPLTGTEMIFIFTIAAWPVIALSSRQTLRTICNCLNVMGPDHLTEKNIHRISDHRYRPLWLRRNNVFLQQKSLNSIQTYSNNFCRIQKFKILSSGLLGLVYSSLMQSRILCTSALLEWYMHNQETDLQATSVRWVTVEKCAELVGWSKDAINALRVKGKIRMDVHWIKRNGGIFIDMAAFQQWIGTGR
jgi:hypothetical protein